MTTPGVETVTEWQAAIRAGRRIGHAIEAHRSIGSTNDRARELLERADGDGSVVVADEQTAGRGRRGRAWLSPPGVNLMASVALRPRLEARDAWRLGLGASLAAAAACRRFAPVALKWPNDVVDGDGRKLAGMLIETIATGERLTGVVIGIGVNVNWLRDRMPAEIAPGATSLADLAGERVDRVELLGALLDALEAEVAALEAGASPLDRYRSECVTLGSRVTVATPDGSVSGRAADLDETGSLLVDAGDGRHAIASGEVVRVEPGVPA